MGKDTRVNRKREGMLKGWAKARAEATGGRRGSKTQGFLSRGGVRGGGRGSRAGVSCLFVPCVPGPWSLGLKGGVTVWSMRTSVAWTE